jgi:hypothetical protein
LSAFLTKVESETNLPTSKDGMIGAINNSRIQDGIEQKTKEYLFKHSTTCKPTFSKFLTRLHPNKRQVEGAAEFCHI